MILILIFIICSCKKEDERLFSEIGEDVVFTDSFSPKDWENPINRKTISSGDVDIGNFIDEDVIDPKLRSILTIVKKFINIIKTKEKDGLSLILNPSAYNSFLLRNSDLNFKQKYTIRIAHPEKMDSNSFWIKFKLIFAKKSFVGNIELEFTGDVCKINDFDNTIFDEMKISLMSKK